MMRSKILIATVALALAAALAMAPAAQAAAGTRSPEPVSVQSFVSWAWSWLASLWEDSTTVDENLTPGDITASGGGNPGSASADDDKGYSLDPNG